MFGRKFASGPGYQDQPIEPEGLEHADAGEIAGLCTMLATPA